MSSFYPKTLEEEWEEMEEDSAAQEAAPVPFCPLRSTAEKEVPCLEHCKLRAENGNCALLNIGSVDSVKIVNSLISAIDDVCTCINNK